MGKTQLAVAYVKRHYKDYSAIIWLNARDEMLLKQSFAHAAERIFRQHPYTVYVQNALRDRDLDEIIKAVKRWLGEARNSRWLAVYDNYDDPTFHNSTSVSENSKDDKVDERDKANLQYQTSIEKGFDIRPFFPDTYQGAIILTTRSSVVKLGKVVPVVKLTNVHDSLQILASTSYRKELGDGETQSMQGRRQ
jgi:hypothetical protein